MPLYASISDLAIGIAWLQSLRSVDYNALGSPQELVKTFK